jgi:hypothetical protein
MRFVQVQHGFFAFDHHCDSFGLQGEIRSTLT